jgi:hypothetical protein
LLRIGQNVTIHAWPKCGHERLSRFAIQLAAPSQKPHRTSAIIFNVLNNRASHAKLLPDAEITFFLTVRYMLLGIVFKIHLAGGMSTYYSGAFGAVEFGKDLSKKRDN